MTGTGPTTLSSGAHADFSREKSYGDFLCLDELLACQRMLGDSNNESLFIIQHQVSELWMKQMLLELKAALACIRGDDLPPAFKMLARVGRIMNQLIQAWDVLSTLTASEYTEFRHKLGHSSGFQSFQYREIEFLLGNKHRELVEPHRHAPAVYERLQAALNTPSLYDEANRLLVRRGFAIAPEALERDLNRPHGPDASIQAAWGAVYRDTRRWFDLYELGEELVDIEDYFRQWRFRHVTTVERVIGFKTGTGGTAGVAYLRKMLEVRLFPELWDLRTTL